MATNPSEEKEAQGLPSTLDLLQQGGDDRIVSVSGCNEYECRPSPDPNLISFASSTASTISESGLAAADALRSRIENSPTATTCDREFNRMRDEIISLCNLKELSHLQIVFAASGTDTHLIASRLISPDAIVMVQSSETGRGVPLALSGRHFSTKSAYCSKLVKGQILGKDLTCPIIEVSIRDPDGSPRNIDRIDHDIARSVISHVEKGLNVLLVLLDVSKTGLIVPSLSCVLELQKEYPESVEVLIDACQFRMAAPTLKAYLANGFLVAVTGSKFLTGPAFSGALLIPDSLRRRKVPRGISAYSSEYEWPAGMRSGISGTGTNFGLLLRWEAALAELRAFTGLPNSTIEIFLNRFSHAIQHRMETDPNLCLLPVPPLHRKVLTDQNCWDRIPTIFPFRIIKNGNYLGSAEIMRMHGLLQEDLSHSSNHPLAALRCCLGQPVDCGKEGSVLRICASARLIVEAHGNPDAVIRRAFSVLDKISLILRIM